jgi:4-amino-4-deoxy-L-arabinose transferase-like glycosyltransferase
LALSRFPPRAGGGSAFYVDMAADFMSIRGYKWTVGILVCIVVLVAWLCINLFRKQVDAAFISFQCETTDQIAAEFSDPESLAYHVQFLESYYQGYSKILEGSPLHRVVERDYQHSLTNAVFAFRRMTTNDLGGDIQDWLKEYGH